MSDHRLCGCGTVIRNGKCAWGHVQADAPKVDFDFVRLGEKPKLTRGAPIEKLPDPDHIEGEAVFTIVDKLNELIDCINAMNEVSL